jgi:hypothetical protein
MENRRLGSCLSRHTPKTPLDVKSTHSVGAKCAALKPVIVEKTAQAVFLLAFFFLAFFFLAFFLTAFFLRAAFFLAVFFLATFFFFAVFFFFLAIVVLPCELTTELQTPCTIFSSLATVTIDLLKWRVKSRHSPSSGLVDRCDETGSVPVSTL